MTAGEASRKISHAQYLIVIVLIWKFTVELSLLWLLLSLRGLSVTLVSHSDDKQDRHMWSMGSQLANLIFSAFRRLRSHHITQTLNPTLMATHKPRQAVLFILLHLLKWQAALGSEKVKDGGRVTPQLSSTVSQMIMPGSSSEQLHFCNSVMFPLSAGWNIL